MKKLWFLAALSLINFSCSEKGNSNRPEFNSVKVFTENKNLRSAKKELENAKINDEFSPEKVIPDAKTAVEISESILFPIYGKDNIIKQRPYDINFIDGYYIINGTSPKVQIGGNFIIIINSKDGKVIKLTHGE